MTTLELHGALAEAESLAEAMRAVSADGRTFGTVLAQQITEIVEVQCDAIDERLAKVDEMLAALRRRIAA